MPEANEPSDRVQSPCAACGAINRMPRNRVRDDPKCGKCKQSVFPDHPVLATDATWAREVDESPIPVLVDFWAEWCGPCRAIAPILEQVAKERRGRLKVVKLDVDQNPRSAAAHRVQSIPMLQLQRGPLFVDKQLGAVPKPMLDAWLDRHL